MRTYQQFEVALAFVSSFPKSPINNVAKNGLRICGKKASRCGAGRPNILGREDE